MTWTPRDATEATDLAELLATQRREKEAASRRLREMAREMSERITRTELAK